MSISLKYIDISDLDSIKLDKLNYNFDQLVANGGGPRGSQGSIGQDGPQGTTGKQGFQGVRGDVGNQGPIGPTSPNYWRYIQPGNIDAETIIPLVYPGKVPPVVSIGYLEKDPEYNTKQTLVNGKIPFQWNIHRQNFSAANLRFLNNEYKVDWKLDNDKKNNIDQMTLGFIDPQDSKIVYQAGQIGFQGTSTSQYSFVINETRARFNVETNFNLPVDIKRNLYITGAGAVVNKVATCIDDSGLLKFKTIAQLPGTVPFGTIVSIMPSIFNDNNNFINSETISINSALDKPLKITVGKGIGTYTGWYLCNGETWTNGTLSRQVPMLGNFNYEIDDNELSTSTNGQGTVEFDPINMIHITGGSNINMIANPSQLTYNVTSTVNTSSIVIDSTNGTTFKIKQLPQIIYLGSNNLYWSNAGTAQSPAVPLTWILDDQNTTLSKLSPDPYPLGDTDDKSAGQSYDQQFLVTAPLGYYWSTLPTPGNISGLPAYATISGISFIDSGDFPETIRVTISVNNHPNSSEIITLSIDTMLFISAATANMNLSRTGDLLNTTVTPSPSETITYNFGTGYTFNLICTADSGYYFSNNTATITPLFGGGTYTINSSVLSSGNTVLTVNVTIGGVSVGTTSLLYGLTVNTFATAPKITYYPNGYPINGNGVYAFVSKQITVLNNTGGSVYIWAGIYQFYTGSGSNTSISGAFSIYSTSVLLSVSAPATFTSNTYYSSSSYLLANGASVTGDIYKSATSDSSHIVQLYWSSTPTGTKYPITTI